MENQEIDVITFFYERGKSKADYIRKESAQRKPERCLFEQTQENVCVSIVCRGKGELYFVKVF